MGVYHEPRVPQGSPTTGEKDVWLEGGEIKFGHWDGSGWVVDSAIAGGSESSTTIGTGEWHVVGATGEPDFQNGFYGYPSLQFRNNGGYLEIAGEAYADESGHCALTIFTLPVGFRPASDYLVPWKGTTYNHWTVYANGDVKVTGTLITFPECFFPNWDSNRVPI